MSGWPGGFAVYALGLLYTVGLLPPGSILAFEVAEFRSDAGSLALSSFVVSSAAAWAFWTCMHHTAPADAC
jgi:hypothetical protein